MSFAHLSRVAWRFIRPEVEEVILYVLAILAFVGIAFNQTIIKGSITSAQTISGTMDVIHKQFEFITNGDDTAAKIFTFGTWFIIGTVVYILAWFLISFANGAFKNIEVSNSYIHPRSFDKSHYWVSIIARLVVQAAAGVSFIIYVSIWLSVFAPAWLTNFEKIFVEGISVDTVMGVLASTAGIIITLHIAAIIFRLMLLRSKYFYER